MKQYSKEFGFGDWIKKSVFQPNQNWAEEQQKPLQIKADLNYERFEGKCVSRLLHML